VGEDFEGGTRGFLFEDTVLSPKMVGRDSEKQY
jgi:hypothetical protein